MNLDLGGPGPGCSAMRVRRLLACELTGAEKERTEAHVKDCARCAAVHQEVVAEREALRRDVPFPQFAAAVAEKLARPQRSLLSRWAPFAAAAGVLLVTGTVLVMRPADSERVRSKGAASAQLFVQDQGGTHELMPDERIAEGARMRLALQPGGRKHAAVVLIEPHERSVVYEGPAVNGPLPQAFEWTGRGTATLLVILSDSSVDARPIRSAADAPRGADVLMVQLRR